MKPSRLRFRDKLLTPMERASPTRRCKFDPTGTGCRLRLRQMVQVTLLSMLTVTPIRDGIGIASPKVSMAIRSDLLETIYLEKSRMGILVFGRATRGLRFEWSQPNFCQFKSLMLMRNRSPMRALRPEMDLGMRRAKSCKPMSMVG